MNWEWQQSGGTVRKHIPLLNAVNTLGCHYRGDAKGDK